MELLLLSVGNLQRKARLHVEIPSLHKTSSSTESNVEQQIDGPQNGPAPQPWDILVSPSEMFKDETVQVQVPHTEYVDRCPKCFGRGHVQCKGCHGRGSDQCAFCHGSGSRDRSDGGREPCASCNGSGRHQCYSCHGAGMVRCGKCEGEGQVINYIEVGLEMGADD